MRVKLVIDSSIAGKKVSEVINTSVCTLSDQVWLPPGPGELVTPGKPCASASVGSKNSKTSQGRQLLARHAQA
jgi:hypothetical protein